MSPILQNPNRNQETDSNRTFFFNYERIMFLGRKIDKIGTDSKL